MLVCNFTWYMYHYLYYNSGLQTTMLVLSFIIMYVQFVPLLVSLLYNSGLQTSMQSDLLRRRVGIRAAYEVLKETDRYSNLSHPGLRSGTPPPPIPLITACCSSHHPYTEIPVPSMSDQLDIDSVLLCCRHGVSLYNVKTIIEHADLPPHVKSALREVSIHWWCGLRLGWGWGWRTNYYTICHAYL